MTVETDLDALIAGVTPRKGKAVSSKAQLTAHVADALSARNQAQEAANAALVNRDQANALATLSSAAAAASVGADAYADLAAVVASKAVTAVDVFVYDTSLDSDGGAWRHRTTGTSWYNEPLNTATRGARREFPAVAVIVAESNKVTIYDGDDPALPMWMVFNAAALRMIYSDGSNPVSCLVAQNGLMVTGNRGFDIWGVSFISDDGYQHQTAGRGQFKGGISNRNDALGFNPYVLPGIVNRAINDVAMTVLPDAPVDPATGLPVPTIAVATAGGVSVIRDDGTVVDITGSNASFNISTQVQFYDRGLWLQKGSSNAASGSWVYYFDSIPSSDTVITQDTKTVSAGQAPKAYYTDFLGAGDLNYLPASAAGYSADVLLSERAIAGRGSFTKGVTHIQQNAVEPTKGMVAYTTSTYNTGWMPGAIRGAFLADTDATALVASGELVTNGTFDTDINGWDASDPALVAWDASGALAVSTVSTADVSARQTIATVPGQRYRFTASFSQNAGTWFWFSSTNYGNNNLGQVLAGAGSGSVTLEFTALTATTYLTILNWATGPVTALYDNVSIRRVDNDRSVNNRGLIVNGTITRSPVATGAELVAYSGFSATNYLEQPYNSALDFGTGDFSIMLWVLGGTNASDNFVWIADPAGPGAHIFFGKPAAPDVARIRVQDASGGADTIDGQRLISGGNPATFLCAVRQSGVLRLYEDGALVGSTPSTRSVSNLNATLTVGVPYDKAASTGSDAKKLALLRISATAPTADQIRRIYEDERHLFQPGAKCTLYGTSDAVTALAHDPVTNLLHVGTSAGRSVFDGLVRVDNTTTAVGVAISAVNGLVVEE